jgi:hypothetical protein
VSKVLFSSLLLLYLAELLFLTQFAAAHDFDKNANNQVPVTPPPSAQNIDNPVTAGGLGAVVNSYKLWRAGSKLSACFQGGSPQVRAFFVETQRLWVEFANLPWDFGDVPYQLLVFIE